MTLVNSKEIFADAIKNKYAIGAFNFINLETLNAIIKTNVNLKSPVIIQCSTSAIEYAGIGALRGMVYGLCSELSIPVCWNLDHGKTFEDCKNAIDAGFTNVMIDASSLPFEENIKLTKKVVEYAHKHGVTVEAELGVLAGVEDDVKATDKDAFYTDPKMAQTFVKKTGVDSLAVAIGTSHGTHKFNGGAKLRFDILSEIEKLLPNFPIVLHGASSIPQDMVSLAEQFGAKLKGANGIPEVMLREASTKHNICKVNVDSDLRLAFTAGIRKSLKENPENVDMRKYNKLGMELISMVISNKITEVFCSENKAAEIK